MSNSSSCAKSLNSLLKKIGIVEAPDFPEANDPVAVLILSFLMWESTTSKALDVYRRIKENMVDFNDLRVCMPHEVVETIGRRYPLAQERCERLRATLRHIFLREHVVSLDCLKGQGKREIKKYIETLDGVMTYSAARIQLVAFNTHGIPVDEQLRGLLVAHEAAEESLSLTDLSSWLSRQIKAEKSLETHYALQNWVDKGEHKVSAKNSGQASTGKKTGKKSPKRGGSKSTTKKTPATKA